MEWCHCRWFFHAVTRHDTQTPESWSSDNEILPDCFRASIVITKPLFWSTQLWKSFGDWCFPQVMEMRVYTWKCLGCGSAHLQKNGYVKLPLLPDAVGPACRPDFSGAKKSLEGTILVFISDNLIFAGQEHQAYLRMIGLNFWFTWYYYSTLVKVGNSIKQPSLDIFLKLSQNHLEMFHIRNFQYHV